MSIESSVVSAHTAYIAVDEDQDKPIEGAIQTWDLSATMAASEGGFGFGGGLGLHAARGGGGMLFGGPPPPQALHCYAAAAAPAGGLLFGGPQLQMGSVSSAPSYSGGGRGGHGLFGPAAASYSAPPPPPGGIFGGAPPPPAAPSMMSFGAPPPPPPPTGGVWPSLARSSAMNTTSLGAPPPPAFGAGPPPPTDNLTDLFSFNSAQQFRQAAPLKSRSVMEKGLGATRFQSSSNELTQLISLQQAEGFWNLDKVSSFMKKTISSPISGVDPTIWATIVALVLLESRFSQQQDEWELVAMKAETWLSMQSLPAGFDVQKLKEEAKKLV